jgi:RNA polymerase sigma-70 factor (ECF subfamily)
MTDGDIPNPGAEDPESSIALLAKVRAGDQEALNRLLARHLPPLQRWARGRLPYGIRDLQDTGDLVQESVIQALKHLNHFEYRRDGALQAYLRQAVYNRIRMEFRSKKSRPARTEIDGEAPGPGASPLEEAIGHEAVERYERALARLKPEDREIIIARMELDCGYAELARATGKRSADAARMALGRAALRLAEEMKHESA